MTWPDHSKRAYGPYCLIPHVEVFDGLRQIRPDLQEPSTTKTQKVSGDNLKMKNHVRKNPFKNNVFFQILN